MEAACSSRVFLSVVPYCTSDFFRILSEFFSPQKHHCENLKKVGFRRVSCILGAFAEFRKATISIVMSVRLSVSVEQLQLDGFS